LEEKYTQKILNTSSAGCKTILKSGEVNTVLLNILQFKLIQQ
jgi:hypothetical protein